MGVRELKDSELLRLVAIKDSDIEAKFVAITELSRRKARRQFLYGTLPAWVAMAIALGSFTVAMASYKLNSKASTIRQTINQPQNPSPETKGSANP